LDECLVGLGSCKLLTGSIEEVIPLSEQAIRLSPRDPILYAFYLEKGFALSLLHQDDQAIGWLRRAGAAAPQWPLPQALLAAELSLTGREAEAHDVLERYLSLSGTRARTIAQWKGQMPSNNPLFLTYAARLVDGLRRAGLPE
jgi:tetratricopeptide (TPR) repeat protein